MDNDKESMIEDKDDKNQFHKTTIIIILNMQNALILIKKMTLSQIYICIPTHLKQSKVVNELKKYSLW